MAMTMSDCHYCARPFSPDEWSDRHSDESGEDVHAHCCTLCEGAIDDA